MWLAEAKRSELNRHSSIPRNRASCQSRHISQAGGLQRCFTEEYRHVAKLSTYPFTATNEIHFFLSRAILELADDFCCNALNSFGPLTGPYFLT